jgi:glutaredoxin
MQLAMLLDRGYIRLWTVELGGAVTETAEATAVVEVYWMPGCTGCLRLKEFVEKSGREYRAINIDEDKSGSEKLKAAGIRGPAACIGDRCVGGLDLEGVAQLLEIAYDPPLILSPKQLVDKYVLLSEALQGFLAQISQEALSQKLPRRDRTMLDVADQATTVMRCFLEAYDSTEHTSNYPPVPDDVRTPADLIRRAQETLEMFLAWWNGYGIDDPLDRVVSTVWGYRTLQEVLEREVWHTAQHTRQIEFFLMDVLHITPERPLTLEDLAGLPLPERIHE